MTFSAFLQQLSEKGVYIADGSRRAYTSVVTQKTPKTVRIPNGFAHIKMVNKSIEVTLESAPVLGVTG